MKPRGFSGKPRTKSRVVKRHWREERFVVPVDDMPRALGWILSMLRERKGVSAKWVAIRAHVGKQTVRDIEQGKVRDYAFKSVDAVARVLHGGLARAVLLTQRFLWHDYLHEKRLHAAEPGWLYVYPWSKKRATPPMMRHAA
jgi:hypothetical protein